MKNLDNKTSKHKEYVDENPEYWVVKDPEITPPEKRPLQPTQ